MSDHLNLWNAVADIDPRHTKPISGRDYTGTSPNPQYLIRLATEHLGPCGHGFGWSVMSEGFEPLGDTILHWCRIKFWWHPPGSSGEPASFEQYGQTKAFFITNAGKKRVDEDAPKKSLTDAVVKALSQIGFAANIFLGRWDDQKYVAELDAEFREADAQNTAKAKAEKASEYIWALDVILGENSSDGPDEYAQLRGKIINSFGLTPDDIPETLRAKMKEVSEKIGYRKEPA